jgi:hypothetical protein
VVFCPVPTPWDWWRTGVECVRTQGGSAGCPQMIPERFEVGCLCHGVSRGEHVVDAAAVVGLGGGLEPLPLVADGEDGTAHQLPGCGGRPRNFAKPNIGWGPNRSS